MLIMFVIFLSFAIDSGRMTQHYFYTLCESIRSDHSQFIRRFGIGAGPMAPMANAIQITQRGGFTKPVPICWGGEAFFVFEVRRT